MCQKNDGFLRFLPFPSQQCIEPWLSHEFAYVFPPCLGAFHLQAGQWCKLQYFFDEQLGLSLEMLTWIHRFLNFFNWRIWPNQKKGKQIKVFKVKGLQSHISWIKHRCFCFFLSWADSCLRLDCLVRGAELLETGNVWKPKLCWRFWVLEPWPPDCALDRYSRLAIWNCWSFFLLRL